MKKKISGLLFVGILLFSMPACKPALTGTAHYNPGTGDISADIGFEFKPIPGQPGKFWRVPKVSPDPVVQPDKK